MFTVVMLGLMTVAEAKGLTWDVQYVGTSVNGLRWYAVRTGGVEYSRYSTRGHAQAVADELRKRNLGPYWHRGMFGDKALKLEREISDAALEVVFSKERK